MANENITDYDYRFVDSDTGLQGAISELKLKIAEGNSLLAVDCEGNSLSREGALTIITVATEEKVYIFDVQKLGQATFSSGLGAILEDESRKKLMFDCRQDSDALWHQFKVKLSGVLDVQLLEVIYRRENPSASTTNTANTAQSSSNNKRGGRNRRSQRTDEIEKIYGFGRCVELYLQDEKLIKIKDKGKRLLEKDKELWTKRPLTDDLIQYCVVDTMAMFRLYNKMKNINGGEQAVFEWHPISMLTCTGAKQKDLSMATKRMRTSLSTLSLIKEHWIFRPLTLYARAAIDGFRMKSSV